MSISLKVIKMTIYKDHKFALKVIKENVFINNTKIIKKQSLFLNSSLFPLQFLQIYLFKGLEFLLGLFAEWPFSGLGSAPIGFTTILGSLIEGFFCILPFAPVVVLL